jgi:excisionase family DNA binding protein
MPQTKKSPQPQPVAQPSQALNGPPGEVLTLDETAAYLRVSASDVLRMVRLQNLPAREFGSEWRFLKAAVQQWLATGSPGPRSSNEALLALAGKWKDDPFVEEELKEIYRRRGRPMTEDEP